jgi:thiamine-phosphate diphosphorylase
VTRDLRCELRRYLITDARAGSVGRLLAICSAALGGGVTAVQLRARGWTDWQLYDAAVALRGMTREATALLIVNDRVDIALAAGADGVHLGVDDLPVAAARRLLGPAAVVGYSPEAAADRVAAEAAGASYLGVGPVFETSTKDDAGAAIGLDGLRRVIAATRLPVVGVGGIDQRNAQAVIEAGAAGVAIVGALFFADDPHVAARRLAEVVP